MRFDEEGSGGADNGEWRSVEVATSTDDGPSASATRTASVNAAAEATGEEAMASSSSNVGMSSLESRFQNLQLIGKGSFGDVFKG